MPDVHARRASGLPLQATRVNTQVSCVGLCATRPLTLHDMP